MYVCVYERVAMWKYERRDDSGECYRLNTLLSPNFIRFQLENRLMYNIYKRVFAVYAKLLRTAREGEKRRFD